jgi:hypothetical protein
MKNYVLLSTLLFFLYGCDNEKELIFFNHYPKVVKENHIEDIFSQIKWSYYKYYEDCKVLIVDISINGGIDTLSSIPLYYHNIEEVIRSDSTQFSISFYMNNQKKNTLNSYITPEYDCFNEEMGSPLYNFFIKKNNLYKIEYIEQVFIEDTTWINNILYSSDEPFVKKLLEHQDSITPWLKNELILRGYLKK